MLCEPVANRGGDRAVLPPGHLGGSAVPADHSALLRPIRVVSAAPYNKAMPEEKASSPNFEASLEELERVVKELEKGDLPLEQSLALFESGMRLSEQCKQQLEDAESRVEILMKKGSEMVAVPFNPDKPAK